jgi:cell division protein FtsL
MQKFNPVFWLMGIVASVTVLGGAAWATSVTSDTRSAQTKLATIEAKIDDMKQDIIDIKKAVQDGR